MAATMTSPLLQSSLNFQINPTKLVSVSSATSVSRGRNLLLSNKALKPNPNKTLQCKAMAMKNPVTGIFKNPNLIKVSQNPKINPLNSAIFTLTNTKAVAAVVSVAALLATRKFAEKIASSVLAASNPGVQALAAARGSVLMSTGAMFLADRVATPMTVVAAALQKWLDLYAILLTTRILLSWFPNIPWERQPFAAMRDLADPYLTLFRNIIPPIKNILDVSPLLAFAVLGFFRTCLENALYVAV